MKIIQLRSKNCVAMEFIVRIELSSDVSSRFVQYTITNCRKKKLEACTCFSFKHDTKHIKVAYFRFIAIKLITINNTIHLVRILQMKNGLNEGRRKNNDCDGVN